MAFCSTESIDLGKDTRRIDYYEESYNDGLYVYEDDYTPRDFEDNISPKEVPANSVQFPFAFPTRTTPAATTSTHTTTATTKAMTRGVTLSPRKAYVPDSSTYKKHMSEKNKESPPAVPNKSQDVACSSPEMLRQFLKSGAHGNDPRKIAMMIKKCQNDRTSAGQSIDEIEEEAAKNIFGRYSMHTKKHSKSVDEQKLQTNLLDHNSAPALPPTSLLPHGYMNGGSPFMAINKGEEADEDYEEYVDEYDEEEEDSFKPYGVDDGGKPLTKPKAASTSSNLFRSFIKNNLGTKGIRRPKPKLNNEDAKAAISIFHKYAPGKIKRPTGNYNRVRLNIFS